MLFISVGCSGWSKSTEPDGCFDFRVNTFPSDTYRGRQGHSIMRPTGFESPWLCDGNCRLCGAFNTLRESQDEFKMRVLSVKNKIK